MYLFGISGLRPERCKCEAEKCTCVLNTKDLYFQQVIKTKVKLNFSVEAKLQVFCLKNELKSGGANKWKILF